MEYFHVMMDGRVSVPKFTLTDQELSSDAIMKQIALPDDVEKSDLIVIRGMKSTTYLVSDGMQSLLELYDESISFVPVQLVDMKRKRMDIYWKVGLLELEKGILNEYEKQEDMQLELAKEDEKPVLMIRKRNRNYLIVNLSVAESMLRRMPIGIRLCRVNMTGTQERSQLWQQRLDK